MKPTFIINKLYNEYSDVEIDFRDKSISKLTGLDPKKVSLKVKGEQWDCTLYSCSMKCAKVVVKMNMDGFQNLQSAKNFVNLNLGFQREQETDPVVFFIPSVIEGYKSINEKQKEAYMFNLNFIQKPSDELIEIIGELIEVKEKYEKRKNSRITINSKILKDIGLTNQNIIVEIDNIKRKGILRNISATGLSILLSCIAKFLINKQIVLYLISSKLQTVIKVHGTIVWKNDVEGRKDIYELGIKLDNDKIPLEYKHLVNLFFDIIESLIKQK
jgi:PilZ domain